ncbi:unnamed protein product [Soboliphyme baturini]|uniref:Mediator of RNA polymerase II transcription subunit 28 n=1 Tax=Soboliphyme baturini TaxID=241478 RepID=A0A183I8W5_9BILA|nr:unnamed protein product [Soboliphyme baturini]
MNTCGKDIIENFEKNFQACISAFASGSGTRPTDVEEVRTSAEVAAHDLIRTVQESEKYFSRYYFLFSIFCPEEVLKEEIGLMKEEIDRKTSIINKHKEKIAYWQQLMEPTDGPSSVTAASSAPELPADKIG